MRLAAEYLFNMSHKSFYTVNHSIFNKINSEESAYLLGFITADGCIHKNGVVSICLSDKDTDHLLKIQGNLESNHSIGFYRDEASLRISSREMIQDLAQYGVVERKSLIIPWPKAIPADHYNHYIRGFIDGDGSFTHSTISKKGVPRPQCAIVSGSHKYLEGLIDHLHQSLDFPYVNINQTSCNNCYIIRYNKVEILTTLYHYLYTNSKLFLTRKKRKLEQLLESNGVLI